MALFRQVSFNIPYEGVCNMTKSLFRYIVVFAFCSLLVTALHSQCDPGLHSGIRAQFLALKNGFTEEAHLQLSFVLLNDSDQPIDVVSNSWRLIVDGVESVLPTNGTVMPPGGYGVLRPGENYEWGVALPMSRYFRNPGSYRIALKGTGFESSTITVDVPPSSGNSK
jgi:hypothetical protein